MTLFHIVFLKIRPNITSDSIQSLTDRIHLLKQEIPLVQRSHAGINLTQRGKGYNYALAVELESINDLNPYRDHPFHQEIYKTIVDFSEDDGILAQDFEDIF